MGPRTKRAVAILGGGIGAIVLLAILAVLVVTRTDWGRERVRAFGVEQLATQVAGRVTIDALGGNLLGGATLEGVAIEDSSGKTFLRADTIAVNYSLRSFLSKHLIFTDVLLVNPTIVLDQPPGEEWNFVRLFPQDTTAAPDTVPGFGSWVRLEDVEIRNGTVIMRTAWSPPDTLSEAQREVAVEEALSAENRQWIVRVPGGYQAISFYRGLDARLPLIRIADPDSAARVIEVESLVAVAFPFRPPAAHVRDLAGTFVVTEDSLHFQDIRVALPGTRIDGSGAYALGDGGVHAAIRAGPVEFDDLRWVLPSLPEGGGRVVANVARGNGTFAVHAERLDLRSEGATVVGHADVRMGDTLRIGATELVFAGLDTRLIEQLARGRTMPVSGRARGRLALEGVPSALRLDGWAEFRERDGGTSRVVARGEIGTGDDLRAESLQLQLDPVRVDLLRSFVPRRVPLAGFVQGTATITGSTATRFVVDADLTHVDPLAGRSRMLADGAVAFGDELSVRDLLLRLDPLQIAVVQAFAPQLPIAGTITGTANVNGSSATRIGASVDLSVNTETGTSQFLGDVAVSPNGGPHFDVDLIAPRLSLATVGEFAPAAGLHGSASGAIGASGTSESIALSLDLALAGGGAMAAAGRVELGAPTLGYDIRAVLDDLDASAASTRAPATGFTGSVRVQGEGTDPATMNARLEARLVDVQWDSAHADTTAIDARLADGLAILDRAHLRFASASADLDGSFGLVAGRTGELSYRIGVDSLSDFAQWIPGDTSAIPPRPVLQARRIAAARADSLRRFRETEVERAATGYPPPPRLDVDSARPMPADSVAGSVRVEGVVAGNIQRFDARGTLDAGGVVAAGIALDSARTQYTMLGVGTDDPSFTVDAKVDVLHAAGFAFDSASAIVEYAGLMDVGRGVADVALFQDPQRDYRVRSEFLLELDRREITFDELLLRFDTIRWTSPHASRVDWAGTGFTIDSLELQSTTGGRIFADGDVPSDGDLDLDVVIDDLPIGQVVALLQDTVEASGRLDLEAMLRGTRTAPRFDGQLSLLAGSYGNRSLPDVSAAFEYADTRLDARGELTRDATTLLLAEAELPVNLALAGVDGPRMLDRPLRIDARMDSVPLEALPSFTESVQNVRGSLTGDVTVVGTFETPEPTGAISLDLASLDLVPAGVALREINGALRIEPEVMTLDSLVALSSGGTIRADGTIGLETLTRPTLDLTVESDNARVLNTNRGRIRADAEVAIAGPIDSISVSGEAQIVDGVIYVPDMGERRPTDLDDPTVAAIIDTATVAEGVLPRNPLLDNLNLDVDVRVARNTWVRNSDGNVEIYTPDDVEPLSVRFSPEDGFALEGLINADRGEYTYSGRLFELTTGSVTFLGGSDFDPLLQLTASYEVPRRGREALSIQIHVVGPLSEPRVTLESTAQPPLPQSDLLAYLAFGRSSSSLLDLNASGISGGGDGGGVGALAQQQLAGLALGALLDEAVGSLEREGTRAGLDVFRIHPAALPEELAFSGYFQNLLRGTELVAGKYVTRRVFLAAQGRTTTESWPGFRLEYTARGGLSLEATWEPRFLPTEPSLAVDQEATSARAFGAFLFWRRRF